MENDRQELVGQWFVNNFEKFDSQSLEFKVQLIYLHGYLQHKLKPEYEAQIETMLHQLITEYIALYNQGRQPDTQFSTLVSASLVDLNKLNHEFWFQSNDYLKEEVLLVVNLLKINSLDTLPDTIRYLCWWLSSQNEDMRDYVWEQIRWPQDLAQLQEQCKQQKIPLVFVTELYETLLRQDLVECAVTDQCFNVIFDFLQT